MGALNALDELLPGPEQVREAAPPPPRGRVRGARRSGVFNALDDLLPGPDQARPEPSAIPLRMDRIRPDADEAPARPIAAEVAIPLGSGGALDAFMNGAPAPSPEAVRRRVAAAKRPTVRTTFTVSRDLLVSMRDAVGQLSAPGKRVTLDQIAEQALQAELDRLAGKRRRTRRGNN
jgi:hypothetical protein